MSDGKYYVMVTFNDGGQPFESGFVDDYRVSWKGKGVVSISLVNGTVYYWPYKIIREVKVRDKFPNTKEE